ncbi:hypothetical protein [Tsukamurella ocularis]|uniref:hypothetical protein n=1 Tax=Tsukamurella ocularis TaxID=1970234 RepID=UPI00216A0A7A|nr:hypothetical protein [Tsukamurella ocularis]MCS3853301.1 hypothetical protein [Tsukamurella ocularis]
MSWFRVSVAIAAITVVAPLVVAAPASADPDRDSRTKGLAESTASSSTVQKFGADGSCHTKVGSAGKIKPDPKCTPGVINPAATPKNVAKTVCKKGWATKQKPAISILVKERAAAAKAYGYPDKQAEDLVLDYLVPLELGGARNDARNLWVQTVEQARKKNVVDEALKAAVCSGTMSLQAAQGIVADDWTTVKVTSEDRRAESGAR